MERRSGSFGMRSWGWSEAMAVEGEIEMDVIGKSRWEGLVFYGDEFVVRVTVYVKSAT